MSWDNIKPVVDAQVHHHVVHKQPINNNNNHNNHNNHNNSNKSGFAHNWRLWRHCCCRYGCFPLIVAPIVTTACVLSLYSSAGCDFLNLDVGFEPSNDAWNQSTAELGLFLYRIQATGIEPDQESKYQEVFIHGCRFYDDAFIDYFIDKDRTWKVARIMAYISGIASLVGTATAWLFVVSPLPAFFFWPGVLLPALMVSFLAEGSKFLFFDTGICANSVWFPSGADSLPRVANSCTLGQTGIFSVAAGAIFFLALTLVCLKAPEKRLLDHNYGSDHNHNNRDQSELQLQNKYPVDSFGDGRSALDYDDLGEQKLSHDYDLCDQKRSHDYEVGSLDREYVFESERDEHTQNGSLYALDEDTDYDGTLSGRYSHDYQDNDDLFSDRQKNIVPSEERYMAKPKDDLDYLEKGGPNDIYPTKPSIEAGDAEPPVISESRLHTIEKMKLNTIDESEDLIERFVHELNLSFQQDDNEMRSSMNDKGHDVHSKAFCQPMLACGPSTARSL